MSSYAEKLKDPRWQKKRLQVLNHAKFRCQICGAKDRTLHVHHSYYEKGKEPWEYPTGSLISVCEDCHAMLHPKKQDPAPELDLQPQADEPVSEERRKEIFTRIYAALKQVGGE